MAEINWAAAFRRRLEEKREQERKNREAAQMQALQDAINALAARIDELVDILTAPQQENAG